MAVSGKVYWDISKICAPNKVVRDIIQGKVRGLGVHRVILSFLLGYDACASLVDAKVLAHAG